MLVNFLVFDKMVDYLSKIGDFKFFSVIIGLLLINYGLIPAVIIVIFLLIINLAYVHNEIREKIQEINIKRNEQR